MTTQADHLITTTALADEVETRPPVIIADHVYKRYQRSTHQVSLRHEAQRLLARAFHRGQPPADEPFWALQDVNFTIRAGESVALVGRNGAGKTTLFRVLCGITHASQGRAIVHGRFATLIALGAGFNFERTGRENIYLNAAIQGVPPREVKTFIEEIIAFSELGEFIDAPVKRYSSGMITRLGFSIAVHIFPDIIFIDEVLAVGDAAFQQKCMERIMAMKAEGRTLMFVSHAAQTVRDLCERAIWLHHGVVQMDGPTGDVLDHYDAALQSWMAHG
jgi:ABC-type polysaccharide/polyol phosphate transport system ATPase subunit